MYNDEKSEREDVEGRGCARHVESKFSLFHLRVEMLARTVRIVREEREKNVERKENLKKSGIEGVVCRDQSCSWLWLSSSAERLDGRSGGTREKNGPAPEWTVMRCLDGAIHVRSSPASHLMPLYHLILKHNSSLASFPPI